MPIDRNSGDSFIFPSSRGTAIGTSNFLFRVPKDVGKKTGIEGATHQMLGRTCSTYMAQITTVKDVQASPTTTLPNPGALHQVSAAPAQSRVTRPSAQENARVR
jgi:hypothetical protein